MPPRVSFHAAAALILYHNLTLRERTHAMTVESMVTGPMTLERGPVETEMATLVLGLAREHRRTKSPAVKTAIEGALYGLRPMVVAKPMAA